MKLTTIIGGLCTAMLTSFAASPTLGLGDTLQLKFSDDTQLQLGVGVDESEPAGARQFCLTAGPNDTVYDVGGSSSAEIITSGVFSLSDLENDFNFDYSIETTASAGIAKLFSAKSTLKNAGKYGLYLKDHTSSIGITIDAFARHGAKRINYQAGLKAPFQAMIDEGRFDEFRQACGTHFVASHTLVSQLSVIFNASNLSNTMKASLRQEWQASIGGKATIKALSIGGDVKTSLTLTNVLTTANRHGTLTYDIKSKGGQGIGSLGQVLAEVTYQTDDVPKIYKSIAEASEHFTRDNAKPETFNLISFDIFGARPATLTPQTVDGMQRVYKRVLRLDAVIDVYDGYAVDRPTLYTAHFKPVHDALRSARGRMVALYRDCRAGGDCTLPTMPELDGIVFLEDVFDAAAFEVVCTHAHSLVDSKGAVRQYFSSADYVIRGRMRFLPEWDQQGIQLFGFGDGDTLLPLTFSPSDRMVLFNHNTEGADVLIQAHTVPIDLDQITDANGDADTAKASALRHSLRDDAILVRIPFHSGLTVDEVFALPDLRRCALTAN